MSFSPSPVGLMDSRSVQEQREKWQRKKTRTAREMVQTEQKYCDELQLVNTYFVEILKAKGTLRQDIRESIFSTVTSIYSVNQSLLVRLEKGEFGRGFDDFCPHLHYYVTYVDNIQNASKVLALQVKKNKAFRRFKKLQESRPEFHCCKLEDLLLLPLQRIQQYKHFLRDLTENTGPHSPDFQQLSRSVEAVSEVAQRIQDNARSHDNQLQLRRVQKLLKGTKAKVIVPGRWYLREGWLRAVPPKGAEAKPKMFFLFSDVLLQAKHCNRLHPTNGDKFAGQRFYPLRDCTVEKVFGHTKSQGGLLSLTFPKAKLLLMSSNQEDIDDWYRSLSSAVCQLKSRNTVIHQRDPLVRRPLRSNQDDSTPTPSTHNNTTTPGRKRMAPPPPQTPASTTSRTPAETLSSASKRVKLSEGPEESAPAGSSCVIL
ncbi:rho guanine nucleotide exchange factor 39 [Esox lucius]|uniref:Rho guanine nucleotide exchange factor (GEF) 39 n=1 Tax=Esox lucius TaxID=8010 RepID=A0A3P8Y6V6_ESOLU|nr:rho guanine nucleotide exchange factor 39 [Esox lucius]